MLLLWIGCAIIGGGGLTGLAGLAALDTQFGHALVIGGLFLMSLGALTSALGIAVRTRDRPPARDSAGNREPGLTRSPGLPASSPLTGRGNSLARRSL